MNILFIGLGRIAKDHVRAIDRLKRERGLNLNLRYGYDKCPETFAVAGLPEDFVRLDEGGYQRALADPGIHIVALLTPPKDRFELARTAIEAGKHILLEKPPCATSNELSTLRKIANDAGLTLFTAYHARESVAVDEARKSLRGRVIRSVDIRYAENVEHWHPPNSWVLKEGVVRDSGINAISAVMHALDVRTLQVNDALYYWPSDDHGEDAAFVRFAVGGKACGKMLMNWKAPTETRLISIETEEGVRYEIDVARSSLIRRADEKLYDTLVPEKPSEVMHLMQYTRIWAQMAHLVAHGDSIVDGGALDFVEQAGRAAQQHRVSGKSVTRAEVLAFV